MLPIWGHIKLAFDELNVNIHYLNTFFMISELKVTLTFENLIDFYNVCCLISYFIFF